MSSDLILTKNSLNFESVLHRIAESNRVIIATYTFGNKSPILEVIKGLPAGRDVTIITAIPNRRAPKPSESTEQTGQEIDQFIRNGNPSNFTCTVSAWFCADNHAKVVLCDDIAYVGSANLTLASHSNFEAGFILRGKAELEGLEVFLGQMVQESIPYLNLQRSQELLHLFKFWNNISTLLLELEAHASEWEVDIMSGEEHFVFSADKFSVPKSLTTALKVALEAANRIAEAANIRSEAEKPDPAFESEDRFAETDWGDCLTELLHGADLINSHEKFHAAFNDSAESEHLADERIGSEPDVTALVNSADFQDELYDRRERHEARRERDARDAYDTFRSGLERLRDQLRGAFIGLGVNPAIRKAPKKYL